MDNAIKQEEKTWLCPICSLERIKHGTNCKRWEQGECPNPPNINGIWYNDNYKKENDAKTIGIGALSDE